MRTDLPISRTLFPCLRSLALTRPSEHDALVSDDAPDHDRALRAFMILLPICLAGLFLVLSFVLPVFADMSVAARLVLPLLVCLLFFAKSRMSGRDDRAWWRSWW